MDIQDAVLDRHIIRVDLLHVDPGDDIAVRHEEQPVAEQRSQHALVLLGGDHLFHGVMDRFQPGDGTHFIDDGHRVGEDGGSGVEQLGDLGAELVVGFLERMQGALEGVIEGGERKSEHRDEGNTQEHQQDRLDRGRRRFHAEIIVEKDL